MLARRTIYGLSLNNDGKIMGLLYFAPILNAELDLP